jgi:hypothetical protein
MSFLIGHQCVDRKALLFCVYLGNTKQLRRTKRELINSREYMWKMERWLNIGPEKNFKELLEITHSYVNDLVKQSLSKGNGEVSSKAQDEKIRTAVELFVEHFFL